MGNIKMQDALGGKKGTGLHFDTVAKECGLFDVPKKGEIEGFSE